MTNALLNDDFLEKLLGGLSEETRRAEVKLTVEDIARLFVLIQKVQGSVINSAGFVAAAITGSSDANERKLEFSNLISSNVDSIGKLLISILSSHQAVNHE